jgi:nucleoside-diphosphate-sugar epimerase
MNVLIIGATGYIGTSVDRALKARGNMVTGIARSDAARERLQARGTSVVRADVAKPQSLEGAVRAAEAVVYCVAASDSDPYTTDLNALRVIARAMAGTEKTFVYTSHAWVYGDTFGAAHEDSPLSPPTLVAKRPELERMTLNMVKIGIRAFVVRPGLVFGGESGGVAAMFRQSARERGAASIVGDGRNHWATIHVDDLGAFYVSLLERGRPGRIYNAVDEHRYTVREIAEAASRAEGAKGATAIVHPELLGPWGACLALDQRVQCERAKNDLGWYPRAHDILAEMEGGFRLIAS